MKDSSICPIVLGHNQFFGVDHLSATRGAQRARQFSDLDRVMRAIRDAQELGARGLMLSSHERSIEICNRLRDEPALSEDLAIYPLLPYAQKYITRANAVGMLNMVQESLSGMSAGRKLATLWGSGRALLAKDVSAMLRSLIRIELNAFRGLDVKAVFLHDTLTDLAVGLELRDVIELYVEEIHESFDAQGALTTKNLPALLSRLAEWSMEPPPIMTHFNEVGYHMNPSREACEQAACDQRLQILAMGTLASGQIPPAQAYRYLGTLPQIAGVVIGASSREHMAESFEEIRQHVPAAQESC